MNKNNKRRIWYVLLVVSLVVLLAFCGWHIIDYYVDLKQTKQTSESIQSLYYADNTNVQQSAGVEDYLSEKNQETHSAKENEADQSQSEPETVFSSKQNIVYKYPQTRFNQLRSEYKDIAAWLKIDGLIDLPVAQKDNQYYMNHDILGRKSENGALFLDESCDLKNGSQALLVYGHNMKSGVMFGSLHEYKKLRKAKEYGIIHFDTMFEDGVYGVFSVATLSTREISAFIDYGSKDEMKKTEMIDMLKKQSIYNSNMEITTDDYLLLLITCEGDKTERRVVVARRAREGESVTTLQSIINGMYAK